MSENTDPYLYPRTDTLKNLQDIRDSRRLDRIETRSTGRRLIELTSTQREFIRLLALGAGLEIDWTKISRDEMTEASIASSRSGDNSGLATLIAKCLS